MCTTSTLILACTILCGIVTIIVYHARRWRLYKFASKIPGPTGLPILGNALFLAANERDLMKKMMNMMDQYPVCRFWIWSKLMISSREPDHIKAMLVNNRMLDKGELLKSFESWLGTGLIMIPGKDWVPRRKFIGSTFNSTILRGFVSIFYEHAKVLVEQLEVCEAENEFDVQHYLSLCAFDMICETTMGVNLKSQTRSDCSYRTAMNTLMRISTKKIRDIWLSSDFIFNLTPYAAQERESLRVQTEFAENLIAKKREATTNTPPQRSDSDRKYEKDTSLERKALLDLLLESVDVAEKMSNEELLYEINTMLTAGSDTTSMGTSFVLLMLASHPDIQERVYEELLEIYGEDDRSISFDDLKSMVQMERVIKETLRLFPVVPFISREATEDVKMGDYVIPKNSTFLVQVISIHRDEKLWPDPMKFDPDRFLPEEIEARHPYAYIPFGAGPRNCIGSRYAMLATKVICAMILRKYIVKVDRISSIANIELQAGIAVRPSETIKLRIEKRVAYKVEV